MKPGTGATIRSTNRRVVCIEGDPALQQLYHELLAELDCQAVLLVGPPPLDRLARLAPDLIVLDLVPADYMRSWDYLLALRLSPATRQIPVLLCTAAIGELAWWGPELTRLGVSVLRKPFAIEDFFSVVRRRLTAVPLADG